MEVKERYPESQSNHGKEEGSRNRLYLGAALVVVRTPLQDDQAVDLVEERMFRSDALVVVLEAEHILPLRLLDLAEDLLVVHIALLDKISFTAFVPLKVLVPLLEACPKNLRFSFEF